MSLSPVRVEQRKTNKRRPIDAGTPNPPWCLSGRTPKIKKRGPGVLKAVVLVVQIIPAREPCCSCPLQCEKGRADQVHPNLTENKASSCLRSRSKPLKAKRAGGMKGLDSKSRKVAAAAEVALRLPVVCGTPLSVASMPRLLAWEGVSQLASECSVYHRVYVSDGEVH